VYLREGEGLEQQDGQGGESESSGFQVGTSGLKLIDENDRAGTSA
jgi:hypothetical protein